MRADQVIVEGRSSEFRDVLSLLGKTHKSPEAHTWVRKLPSSSIRKDQRQILRQMLVVFGLPDSQRPIDDPGLALLQREHLVVDTRRDEVPRDENLLSLTETVDPAKGCQRSSTTTERGDGPVDSLRRRSSVRIRRLRLLRSSYLVLDSCVPPRVHHVAVWRRVISATRNRQSQIDCSRSAAIKFSPIQRDQLPCLPLQEQRSSPVPATLREARRMHDLLLLVNLLTTCSRARSDIDPSRRT